ncbi:MAG: RNA polymerase sigma-70 factor [Bacteroidales bacterium]|nr:RNA polymerase sigma-70 factor [Bacteroidales bacterium]
MKAIPADEKALLWRISEGDESAFRKIYDTYYDHIYNAAYAFMKSPYLAEDATQEVFCKVWHKRAMLPEVEKFDAWLFIMARNHILTEIKNNLRQANFVEQLRLYVNELADSPLQDLLTRESESLIRDAVEQLPPQQKSVFRLSREEGLSQDEIALKLSISKNTVRNHMNAALKYLRHCLLTQRGMPKAFLLFLL